MALPPLFGVTAPIPAYATETYALLAKMTAQPTDDRALIIDTCIRALQAADVWNKFDGFYVLAAADSQVARLNWVFPGHNTLTEVNSPAFVADQGYTGDGSTSYLDTGIAHNTLVRGTQNNAHVAAWCRVFNSANKAIIGAANARLLINPQITRAIRINTGTTSAVASDAGGVGYYTGVRRDGTTQYTYKNGTAELSNAAASSAPDATTITILRNSFGFNNDQCLAGHFGSQLSAADVLAIYNAINAYKTSIGA